MKLIQRIIYTGFAAVTIASAAMPVFPAHAALNRAGVPVQPAMSDAAARTVIAEERAGEVIFERR